MTSIEHAGAVQNGHDIAQNCDQNDSHFETDLQTQRSRPRAYRSGCDCTHMHMTTEKSEGQVDVPNVKFVTNETPHCLWHEDIRRISEDFISTLDPEFFRYTARTHADHLEGDNKHEAAKALRLAYYQGLETLLSHLCAIAQAPDCIVGWISRYRNSELYELVRKIQHRERIYTRFTKKSVGWDSIAEFVFLYLKTGDEEMDVSLRTNFGRLWTNFAQDFLDVNRLAEYNSMKHGNRARMGGFSFAMGLEDTPGVPAPSERMRVMAQSEFGSSFYVPEKLHDSRNFTVRHQALNWHPEDVIHGLELLAISIEDVIGCLKILYGVPPEQIQFRYLTDEEQYRLPWAKRGGMGISWNAAITEADIQPAKKDEIIDTYS